MRKKIIAGNWKMNKTNAEAASFASDLKHDLATMRKTEIVVCPPFTALTIVCEILKNSPIKVGAQNLHWEHSGAFTGEVSAEMIVNTGCTYAIIGHSERRHFFGETNQAVNKKIKHTLTTSLTPIVCIGETLQERQSGQTRNVVLRQIEEGLGDLSIDQIKRIIIAYEPVWAIGTGVTATPEQAEEVHQFIRDMIREKFDGSVADSIPILYGGSVKPDNIKDLLSQKNIDGGLIGGASLNADGFVKMVKIAEELTN